MGFGTRNFTVYIKIAPKEVRASRPMSEWIGYLTKNIKSS